MKPVRYIIAIVTAFIAATALPAYAQEVRITPDLPSVEYTFRGNNYTIARDQNPEARIPEAYTLTSRACPPFCVQPASIHPQVETVEELELLAFLQDYVSTGRGFLIDARTSDWYAKGTIPGAVNLPHDLFKPAPDNVFFDSIMSMLGGRRGDDGDWRFVDPKDLLLFCNGPWCGQSADAIHNLIAINYPPEKLHWYRSGMQGWVSLGFNTEMPKAQR